MLNVQREYTSLEQEKKRKIIKRDRVVKIKSG